MKNSPFRYPATRLRRMRQDDFSRQLKRETFLGPQHLIYPVFIHQHQEDAAISSLPGQSRLSADTLRRTCATSLELGVKAVALFPVVDDALKTVDGKEAFNPEGLVPRTLQMLKKEFGQDLTVITDIALDPYTSHGQDGLLDESGQILNDPTVEILKQQALTQAQAGADIVAPSDMMDGRIGAIRQSLDLSGFQATKILSYAAKYNSSYYGPFREAVGSSSALKSSSAQDSSVFYAGAKMTYQMDIFNSEEALHEVSLDLAEGADMVMVKPGLPYLDIVRLVKETFKVPTLAYQVSGEYAALKAAHREGWLDPTKSILETLICFRRAGADGIFSYFALEAAKMLRSIS